MSNRWLRTDFLKCMKCTHLQRHVSGYKSIPNPILFKADEQCRAWSKEKKNSVGFADNWKFLQCEGCNKMHGDWQWLDFQRFLTEKEKQQQKLSRSSGGSASGSSAGEKRNATPSETLTEAEH